MALTVSVPAASRELVGLEDVKEELRTRDNSLDAELERLITTASFVIEEFCERTFAKQTYIETLEGSADVNLALSVTPVVSITEIKENGVVIDATSYELQEPELGFVYKETGWYWAGAWVGGLTLHPKARSGKHTFEATYVGGYDLPNDASPTLPYQVERAAMITVKDWYQNKARNVSIMRMKSAGTEYRYYIELIPASAMQALSKWRNVE